jgi:hypothetical protein
MRKKYRGKDLLEELEAKEKGPVIPIVIFLCVVTVLSVITTLGIKLLEEHTDIDIPWTDNKKDNQGTSKNKKKSFSKSKKSSISDTVQEMKNKEDYEGVIRDMTREELEDFINSSEDLLNYLTEDDIELSDYEDDNLVEEVIKYLDSLDESDESQSNFSKGSEEDEDEDEDEDDGSNEDESEDEDNDDGAKMRGGAYCRCGAGGDWRRCISFPGRRGGCAVAFRRATWTEDGCRRYLPAVAQACNNGKIRSV